jgi:hypothetical protein
MHGSPFASLEDTPLYDALNVHSKGVCTVIQTIDAQINVLLVTLHVLQSFALHCTRSSADQRKEKTLLRPKNPPSLSFGLPMIYLM